MIEEYFPRGGKKPSGNQFPKHSTNFLGVPLPNEKKRNKNRNGKRGDDDGYLSDSSDDNKSKILCSNGISYASINKDVLLLGRVTKVTETKIHVSLPCKISGVVMACHINNAYNDLLNAYVNDQVESILELNKLFYRGQYVAVKIIEKQKTANDYVQLMLTLMPQHINSSLLHSDVQKGLVLQGAVSAIEDHGYIIDLGIPNTRTFMKKSDIDEEASLEVGSLIWCAILKVLTDKDVSTVTVSNKRNVLDSAHLKKLKDITNSAKCLLPGVAVDFTIDKAFESGVEGRVFNDQEAFIQRFHMTNVKGKKPQLGYKVKARLLYVLPTTKTPFFTMKPLFDKNNTTLDEEQQFKEGDILNDVQIFNITGRTLYLRLDNNNIGFISKKKIQVDEELSDADVIAKSHPVGSKLNVRILSYHPSDYLYSCTDELNMIKEKYFLYSDLAVGDFVDGKVIGIYENSVHISIGRLKGIIPKTHITDAGLTIDTKGPSTTVKLMKKKFKEGQEIKARVQFIDVEKDLCLLTMKPTFMDPNCEILSDFKEAKEGKSYKGFIRSIDQKLIVGFFNGLTAIVPKHHISSPPVENLSEVFHIGQIVTVTIINKNENQNKLFASLIKSPYDPSNEVNKERKNKRSEFVDNDPIMKRRKDSDNSHDEVKTKKKKKAESIEEPITKKVESDFSDAIETDIVDDTEGECQEFSYLTTDDAMLINLDDCITQKNFKKRVVSLKKSINNRLRRRETVEYKIDKMEKNGLTPKNKKIHDSLQAEKIIIEKRIEILMTTLSEAQNKLKEFPPIEPLDYKRKKKESLSADDSKKECTDFQIFDRKLSENKECNNIDGYTSETKEIVKNIELKKQSFKKSEGDVKDTNLKKERAGTISKKEELNKERQNVKDVIKKSKEKVKFLNNEDPGLEIPNFKDIWTGNTETLTKTENEAIDENSSSSDEEVQEAPKKKRKRMSEAEKVQKARQEEEKLREIERKAALDENTPQSSDQFERLLLANPNSSELWIAYMAFYLQSIEIDKARAVGRKAFQTISFREEQEKLNVWLAMLNFEHRFGNKDSQKATIDEALKMNDTFEIHSKMLDIYAETSQLQELQELVDLMLKKYKRNPKTYLMAGAACFKVNLVEKARAVMQKGITVLDKKEHIGVIVQFAKLERQSGDRERAEALLEQIVGLYPQRVDVWCVYADMLFAAKDIDNIRRIMERAISNKLPAKKMKSLYKKWIEIEDKVGDKTQIEKIRQMALEFIEKAKF